LDWVPNFEKTRWFLVLRVNAPGTDGLNKLLHVANRVVQEHGQPPLYIQTAGGENSNQPSESMRSSSTPIRGEPDNHWKGMHDASSAFHVSIAWTLEAPSNAMIDTTNSVAINEFEVAKKASIGVQEIKVKVGNVVTNVRLARNVPEGIGLLGL
jgi:U6 snRNA phosphodiesterase